MAKSTVDALRSMLSDLSLDSRGHKATLMKRLAKASKVNQLEKELAAVETRPAGQMFDSFLVCDVEATCEDAGIRRNGYSYPNEIIEFPAILLQWRREANTNTIQAETSTVEEVENESIDQATETRGDWVLEVIDVYHSYVKPVWRPVLSEFCTTLTGITQEQVNSAPMYSEMLEDFYNNFVLKHGLFTRANKTIWCTDGPWDLRDFIAKAGHINQSPRPPWLIGPIIDLRLTTSEFFSTLAKRKPRRPPSPPLRNISDDSLDSFTGTLPASIPSSTSSLSLTLPTPEGNTTLIPNHQLIPPPTLQITSVLASLHLPPFIGRQHSGLADSHNIARILQELARRGMRLIGNRNVGGKEEKWNWMKKGGGVNWKDEVKVVQRVKGKSRLI